MTDTEFKLIQAQIGGLQALFSANFDVLNENNKEQIVNQKITNGRINSLEKVNKVYSAQLSRVIKIQELQNDKGIRSLLWFSEKWRRLLIIIVPFYLFTISDIRHPILHHLGELFSLIKF